MNVACGVLNGLALGLERIELLFFGVYLLDLHKPLLQTVHGVRAQISSALVFKLYLLCVWFFLGRTIVIALCQAVIAVRDHHRAFIHSVLEIHPELAFVFALSPTRTLSFNILFNRKFSIKNCVLFLDILYAKVLFFFSGLEGGNHVLHFGASWGRRE